MLLLMVIWGESIGGTGGNGRIGGSRTELVEILASQLVRQLSISLRLSLSQLEADSLSHITRRVALEVGAKLRETCLGGLDGGRPVGTAGKESRESILTVGTPHEKIPNDLFLGGIVPAQAIANHGHELGDPRGVESQAAEFAV